MKATIEELLEYFKGALDTASDAIGMSTSEGKHWYQNKAFENLFGDIGQDPPSSVYADEHVGRNIFNTIMAGKRWTGNVTMKGKDGNLLNIFLRAYPIKDANGDVISLVGVHTDVTKEKQDREMLHLQHDLGIALSGATNLEEALTLIVEAVCKIPDMDCGGVYLVNQNSKALNLSYSKGLSPQFVKKISYYEKDSDQAKMITKGKAIFADYSQLKISRDVVKQKEKLRAIAIIPILHRGKAIGALNVASHSINSISLSTREHLETIASQVGSTIARVIVEENNLKQNFELQLLSKKLRTEINEHKLTEKILLEERDKVQKYLDLASVIFVALNDKGEVTLINTKGCELLGYEKEEIIRKNWFKNFLPKRIASKLEHIFTRLLSGEFEVAPYFENPILTKEGNERTIAWHNAMIRDDNGQIVTSLSSGQDITDQLQAEKEKKILETQLQQAQKMESIGTLAGGIAHDFNNILSPVLGYTELLLEDIPEESPLRISVNEVLKGALRARDLVKQILTFSRQAKQETKPLKVQYILKEVLLLSRSTLPTTIQIKQDIYKECGMIMADPTQVHQIVMNLITNAFHAMEESGGTLTVGLKEVDFTQNNLPEPNLTPGPYVCLTIADTGTGMDVETQERLFEPYFTTKERDKGTGIGLAVVHSIVSTYRGAIVVESEHGKGTKFKVYIPRIVSDAETKSEIQPTALLTGSERILLVDDEEPISVMNKAILERLGYQVTVRNSSTDTLEAFRDASENFDLVITDMTMPNLTGDKLAIEIKKIRSDIPVILCTGFSEKISEGKSSLFGIDGIIMKPVSMDELARVVRNVLDSNEQSVQ
jgi:PAS domain S-box-containing protein